MSFADKIKSSLAAENGNTVLVFGVVNDIVSPILSEFFSSLSKTVTFMEHVPFADEVMYPAPSLRYEEEDDLQTMTRVWTFTYLPTVTKDSIASFDTKVRVSLRILRTDAGRNFTMSEIKECFKFEDI